MTSEQQRNVRDNLGINKRKLAYKYIAECWTRGQYIRTLFQKHDPRYCIVFKKGGKVRSSIVIYTLKETEGAIKNGQYCF